VSIDRSALEAAAKAIDEADTVALACHIGPDGDALGSMLALALAAANEGKEVVASFGSPHEMPPTLSFLPDGHLVPPEQFPEAPEVMVVLDAGSADRLGDLAPNAMRSETLVVLDHHVTNEGFGDIAVVDPASAATGEIVYAILEKLGWSLSPEIAQCLQTALVTDTGRFQYANTTPRTLEIASTLVAAGATPNVIGRHVYEEAPFGYLKAAAAALGRAELDEDRSVVSTVLTEEDLDEAGISWAETENLIDLLRLAVEADTAVLVKVHAGGAVKVSLRSRGDTDVGGLASSMGGGGHRLAAGFTSNQPAERVLAHVLESIGEYR
jgi:phosphoesterase RecJ-like protein